jgi:hypothetical protein
MGKREKPEGIDSEGAIEGPQEAHREGPQEYIARVQLHDRADWLGGKAEVGVGDNDQWSAETEALGIRFRRRDVPGKRSYLVPWVGVKVVEIETE